MSITSQLKKVRLITSTSKPTPLWHMIFIIAGVVYALRAGQYLLNPQLYAEDGVLWLAEGYNKNFLAVFEPVNGFLHFPERVFGFIVAHLPLEFAPIIFVITAWLLFILAAYYLLSERTNVLTTNYERLFLLGALCLIANVEIIFFNFSNSVFLLGIIGVLIMLAKKPKFALIGIIEKALFVLSCLTLSFAWFYLPIALIERFHYKQKNYFFLFSAVVGTIIQLVYYLLFHIDRSHIGIFSLFSQYTLLEIYNQIITPAIRFARIDIPVLEFSTQPYLRWFASLAAITLLISTFIVLKNSKKQVWYLLFFLSAMTFAVIKSPSLDVKTAEEAFKNMAVVTGAGRYFIFGIIGVSIIYIRATHIILKPHARYVFMVFFIGFGLVTSLQYKSFFIEKGFVNYSSQYYSKVRQFQKDEIKKQVILVNPTPWHMTLYKK